MNSGARYEYNFRTLCVWAYGNSSELTSLTVTERQRVNRILLYHIVTHCLRPVRKNPWWSLPSLKNLRPLMITVTAPEINVNATATDVFSY